MVKKRGQVSIEFLVAIGAVLLLFFLIVVFSVGRSNELTDLGDYIEKRSDCLKVANLINSVHVAGPGAEAFMHTDYLITIHNFSLITVEDVVNASELPQNRISILLSEAGASTFEFYSFINSTFSPKPDWYKSCFSDLGGPGCDWNGSSWMETEIPLDIDDLMNNLDNYQTIYLENPTMHYSYNYTDLLEEWVAKGNVLVLSRHVMCREIVSGTYSQNYSICNPPGDNNDEWDMFNVTISQRDDAWGYDYTWNMLIKDVYEAYTLDLGDTLSFKTRSYVMNDVNPGFGIIGYYGFDPALADSLVKPGIAHWNYGDGKIYYFGDFEAAFIGKKEEFRNVIANILQTAYYLLLKPIAGDSVTCSFSSNVPYNLFTGDVLIKNTDNLIKIFNATEM